MIKPLLLALALAITAPAFGQDQKTAEPKASKTKIEAFEAKTGVAIIRGFSTVGTIKGQFASSVKVESREFIEAGSGKHEFGICIQITEGDRLERKDSSYIDYDEIDSLLKGIDYITKLDKSSTQLDTFQAEYRTRSELTISVFSNSDGKLQGGIKSRSTLGAMAFISLNELAIFRELVSKAKDKLDAIKK